jgi:hypothetical protein
VTAETAETFPDVSGLYVDSVHISAVDRDWDTGYPDVWDWIRVPRCPWCETVCPDEPTEVEVSAAQARARELVEDWTVEAEVQYDMQAAEAEAEGATPELEVGAECCPNPDCENFRQEVDPFDADDGPAMSYSYALPSKQWGSAEQYGREDAAKIANLPLCIVTFEDTGEQALALTGGGMDLSWEICEAYMRLGFLPPANYCDLPGMAGYPRGERHRWVIAGCLRTCEVLTVQAERMAERLRDMTNEEV